MNDVGRETFTTYTGRGGVRSTRGQSIGISIAMLPQTFWGDMEAIAVQKTPKYYTMWFDLEEWF